MAFTRARRHRASVELPARTVLRRRRHRANVTYEKEHPGTFALDSKQKFFQGFTRGRTRRRRPARSRSSRDAERLLHVARHRRHASSRYYGDNHPRYNGNVVKAMASAKHGYPHVVALFADEIARARSGGAARARARLAARWSRSSTIDCWRESSEVVRLTPTIVEVIVRAPAAARHFHPGQFYRLQNFERLSPHVRVDDHVASMLMEGIALTGAWVDRGAGPAVAHHARDGRVEPAVRVPQARASPSS